MEVSRQSSHLHRLRQFLIATVVSLWRDTPPPQKIYVFFITPLSLSVMILFSANTVIWRNENHSAHLRRDDKAMAKDQWTLFDIKWHANLGSLPNGAKWRSELCAVTSGLKMKLMLKERSRGVLSLCVLAQGMTPAWDTVAFLNKVPLDEVQFRSYGQIVLPRDERLEELVEIGRLYNFTSTKNDKETIQVALRLFNAGEKLTRLETFHDQIASSYLETGKCKAVLCRLAKVPLGRDCFIRVEAADSRILSAHIHSGTLLCHDSRFLEEELKSTHENPSP